MQAAKASDEMVTGGPARRHRSTPRPWPAAPARSPEGGGEQADRVGDAPAPVVGGRPGWSGTTTVVTPHPATAWRMARRLAAVGIGGGAEGEGCPGQDVEPGSLRARPGRG